MLLLTSRYIACTFCWFFTFLWPICLCVLRPWVLTSAVSRCIVCAWLNAASSAHFGPCHLILVWRPWCASQQHWLVGVCLCWCHRSAAVTFEQQCTVEHSIGYFTLAPIAFTSQSPKFWCVRDLFLFSFSILLQLPLLLRHFVLCYFSMLNWLLSLRLFWAQKRSSRHQPTLHERTQRNARPRDCMPRPTRSKWLHTRI